jgi:type II secretion system protein G
MRKLLKGQQGFTLLELLIVIVIIGILALIIVPGLASGPKRARDAQRKSDMRAVKNALETYYNDNNVYPPGNYGGLGTYLVNAYIPSMPSDPKTGNSGYEYAPTSGCDNSGTNCVSYTLTAHLENNKDSQIVSGNPGGTNNYVVNSTN